MSTIIQTRPSLGHRSFRSGLRAVLAAFRAPAAEVAPVTPTVADPDGLLTADEMPPAAHIEAEVAKYYRAVEQARTADRTKRAARKLLDRLPAGKYGAWQVERVESAREVADLDAIRAIFAANGLGTVPMKPCAPSLKVGPATVNIAAEQIDAELRALAGAR